LRFLLSLLIFFVLIVPSLDAKEVSKNIPEAQGISSERLARIDAHLNRTVGAQRVKGIVGYDCQKWQGGLSQGVW